MSPKQPPKHRQCGAQQVNERLYEQYPDLRGRHREIEDECQEFISSGYAERVRRKKITLAERQPLVARSQGDQP